MLFIQRFVRDLKKWTNRYEFWTCFSNNIPYHTLEFFERWNYSVSRLKPEIIFRNDTFKIVKNSENILTYSKKSTNSFDKK